MYPGERTACSGLVNRSGEKRGHTVARVQSVGESTPLRSCPILPTHEYFIQEPSLRSNRAFAVDARIDYYACSSIRSLGGVLSRAVYGAGEAGYGDCGKGKGTAGANALVPPSGCSGRAVLSYGTGVEGEARDSRSIP